MTVKLQLRRAKRPALLPGKRIYAVGDIHGRLDLLDSTLAQIYTDIGRGSDVDPMIVFLGDYVDRGAESAGVIERLNRLRISLKVVCLKGNHEAVFLDFMANPSTLENWAKYGGLSTLLSYGLKPTFQPSPDECVALGAEARRAVPKDHSDFLESLPSSFSSGDFFFCHAGIRPNVPLDKQRDDDLLWIREDFLIFERPHEKIIVHGHTPVPVPDVRSNRINIDTGAYATGRLTCLVLERDDFRFL